MRIIIDLVLLLIVALCIWNGYKSGLVGGFAGILAIIIALLAGSMLSSNYAYEAIPVLEPFVDGYIDSQKTRDEVLDEMGYGSTDLSLEDVLESDSSLRYDYAFFCIRQVGFSEQRAEELAERAVRYSDQTESSMTEVLCDAITYVMGLTLSFLLILILLIAVSSIGNLVFRLPDSLQLLDELGGALVGFVKGFLYCVLLCWLLSFLGLIIGKDTLENTLLARFFLTFRFLTNGLL